MSCAKAGVETVDVTTAELRVLLRARQPALSHVLTCLSRLGLAKRVGFRRQVGRPAPIWRIAKEFHINLQDLEDKIR